MRPTIKELVEAAYLHGLPVENLDTGELEPPKDIVDVQWITDRINQYISEIITGKQDMYFSNEVPVFNNLKEWMNRVALIRETLRNEQRARAGITAKGDSDG